MAGEHLGRLFERKASTAQEPPEFHGRSWTRGAECGNFRLDRKQMPALVVIREPDTTPSLVAVANLYSEQRSGREGKALD